MTESNQNLIRKVYYLSVFTIVYNVLEGLVSVFFGIEESSSALVAFGGDSFVEAASALVVIWRFFSEARLDHSKEKVSGKEKTAVALIGILFLLLGLGVVVGSVMQLKGGVHPQSTLAGTLIAMLSIGFMFWLYFAKRKLGVALQSPTVLKDAECSRACIQLSVVLLIGSSIFWIAPSLWWVDSVAALVLSYFIFKEGIETLRAVKEGRIQDGCCAHD